MAGVTGLFGNIPFVTSSAVCLTFKDLKVERSNAVGATHEVIGKKPVVEARRTGSSVGELHDSTQLASRYAADCGSEGFADAGTEKEEAQRLLTTTTWQVCH